MKKLWLMLRVGGASLRWALYPEEIYKPNGLSWREVVKGQWLAAIVIGTPIVASAVCVVLHLDWLGYALLAMDSILIGAFIRPLRRK